MGRLILYKKSPISHPAVIPVPLVVLEYLVIHRCQGLSVLDTCKAREVLHQLGEELGWDSYTPFILIDGEFDIGDIRTISSLTKGDITRRGEWNHE